jgi:hypothetical protein
VDKYFGGLTSLSTASGPFTPTELKAVFQGDIQATKDLDAAESDVKAKRLTQRAKRKDTLRTRRDIKRCIEANYSPPSVVAQMLADFDYPPAKARTQTVKSKSHSVAQNQATRIARGTKGPKAKAAIKGVVPETAPAAPAAPAAPTTK